MLYLFGFTQFRSAFWNLLLGCLSPVRIRHFQFAPEIQIHRALVSAKESASERRRIIYSRNNTAFGQTQLHKERASTSS